jgi:hypothetical protein
MKNPWSTREAARPKPSDANPGINPDVMERLFADRLWTENYRVTDEEKIMLTDAAMMGEVLSERDVLFILNQIRRARLRW